MTETTSGERQAAKRATLVHLPALDGLRGLAVVAVVAYHKGYGWAAGGFLGVSTFFTLSGFLITSLLIAEHQSTGRIDLVAFWGRRARRLLPAAFLTLFGIITYGWLGGAGIDLVELRGDVIAALVYVANWREYFQEESYISLFTAPSPLDHFWSLAIEEQFYLFFPLVAAALLAVARRGPANSLRYGIVALMSLSVLATALTATSSTEASPVYYSTFTRAGEILMGALLASFIAHRLVETPLSSFTPPSGDNPSDQRDPSAAGSKSSALTVDGSPAEVSQPASASASAEASATMVAARVGGLVALVVLLVGYSQLSFDTEWLHRGGFFAVALVSTAVVAAVALDRGGVTRLLAAPPLIGLGKISYGIYLIHWPVLLYLNDDRTGLTGLGLLAVQLLVILGLAVASYFLFEQPIRRRQLIPSRVGGPLIPIVGLAIFAFAALIVPDQSVDLSPDPELAGVVSDIDAASDSGTPTDDGPGTTSVATAATASAEQRSFPATDCFKRGEEFSGFDITADPGTDLPKVMLVGDSVSCTLGQGLAPWATSRESLTVLNNATLGCGIMRLGRVRTRFIDDEPVSPACDWDQRWRDQIEAYDPDITVVLTGAWDVYDRTLVGSTEWVTPGDDEFDEYLAAETRAAVEALISNGGRVVWLTSPLIELGRNAPQIEGEWPSNEPTRMQRYNEVIAATVGDDPAVDIVDLAGFTASLPGGSLDKDFRPDGVHFTPESAGVVSEWLGPLLEVFARDAASS